jgi:hypothetical protein
VRCDCLSHAGRAVPEGCACSGCFYEANPPADGFKGTGPRTAPTGGQSAELSAHGHLGWPSGVGVHVVRPTRRTVTGECRGAVAWSPTQSVNHQLVAAGLVYPTYYSKLFPDLRDALTTAANQARADQQGVWEDGATTSGATITSLEALNNELVILPKLFRRLVGYLALGAGDISLDGFLAFLASRDDRLFVISEAHATGLDNITRVEGPTGRVLHPPDDLIFIEA